LNLGPSDPGTEVALGDLIVDCERSETMNTDLISKLNREWGDYYVMRKFKFDESEARGGIAFGKIKREIVDNLDVDLLKELYFRGSWLTEKLDKLIEGRCGAVAFDIADECEAAYYFSQLKYGDLELMRYSEAKNPERIFELELSIDRFIGKFLLEPASERGLKRLNDAVGYQIKSGKFRRLDILKIGNTADISQIHVELEEFDCDLTSNKRTPDVCQSVPEHILLRSEPLIGLTL